VDVWRAVTLLSRRISLESFSLGVAAPVIPIPWNVPKNLHQKDLYLDWRLHIVRSIELRDMMNRIQDCTTVQLETEIREGDAVAHQVQSEEEVLKCLASLLASG